MYNHERNYWLQLLIDVYGYQVRTPSIGDMQKIRSYRKYDCRHDCEHEQCLVNLFILTTLSGLDWNEIVRATPEEIIKLIENYESVYD